MAVQYGRVLFKLLREVPDTDDIGSEPDLAPVEGAVLFTRPAKFRYWTDTTGTHATIYIADRSAPLDEITGVMRDADVPDEDGILLAAGPWQVAYDTPTIGQKHEPFGIVVVADETLDLTDVTPINPNVVNPSIVGPPGPSAYDTWLAEGNLGSEGDFLASLVGPQGPVGDTGVHATDTVPGIIKLGGGDLAGTYDHVLVPELGDKLNRQPERRTITADYTLTGADVIDTMLHVDSATDVDITIPLASSVVFPFDIPVRWRQVGLGRLIFGGPVGVTILQADDQFTSRGQGAEGRLTPIDTDVWVLSGDLTLPAGSGGGGGGDGSAWTSTLAWTGSTSWTP